MTIRIAAAFCGSLVACASGAETPSPKPSVSEGEPQTDPAPAASAEVRLRPTESARPPEGINARWVAIDPAGAASTLERDGREVFEHREVVLETLGIASGQTVADIGAGSGFFVKMMADAVGPSGTAYAVDIAPALVQALERWAHESGTRQLKAVLGAPDDVRLPERSIDLVFISDTYHHFEDPAATMATVHAAMKPGGRLFVLDFERVSGRSPDWILEHVRAGKQTVIAELERTGFSFVREHDVPGLEENYVIELAR